MNVKDLILYQPAEELAMAFADRLGIDPERREKAAQRMLRLILTLHGMEPCKTGHLLLGIYHFDADGEFLDPCLYDKKEIITEFDPASAFSQLKDPSQIDALDDDTAERLAHIRFRPESYGFELSPWNEILGFEVDADNVQAVGAAALCLEILYEMTFFGFEEEQVEAERQRVYEAVRESEEIRKLPEEEQEKHFIPAERIFTEFNVPERTEKEQQADHRRLCREVLSNNMRTYQALRAYVSRNRSNAQLSLESFECRH